MRFARMSERQIRDRLYQYYEQQRDYVGTKAVIEKNVICMTLWNVRLECNETRVLEKNKIVYEYKSMPFYDSSTSGFTFTQLLTPHVTDIVTFRYDQFMPIDRLTMGSPDGEAFYWQAVEWFDKH